MSRPIYASPRFTLIIAFAIMVGATVAEIIGWTMGHAAYLFGARFGIYTTALDNPNVQAVLTTLAKVFACAVVTALVLHRSRERWSSLGRNSLFPLVTSLAFVLIVAGIVIFLSELDNAVRVFGSDTMMDEMNWAPSVDFLFTSDWIGPLLLVVLGPLTE
ncbi:MAG: hypothetical protein ABIZ81_02640, partial [Opitutaceae bacterium]